jgi:hypothetical protein
MEDFYVRLKLQNVQSGFPVSLADLDFFECHYFMLDRLPDEYEQVMSLDVDYESEEGEFSYSEGSSDDSELASEEEEHQRMQKRYYKTRLLHWLHFIKK